MVTRSRRTAPQQGKTASSLFPREGEVPGEAGGWGRSHSVAASTASWGKKLVVAFALSACIAAATGKPVHICKGLRERYVGDFIGTSSVGLDWRIDPPNGETMVGFIERTIRGVDEILDEGGLSLLVSHGGVLRVLCGALDKELPVELTQNGLPLLFECNTGTWTVTSLVEPRIIEQLGAA